MYRTAQHVLDVLTSRANLGHVTACWTVAKFSGKANGSRPECIKRIPACARDVIAVTDTLTPIIELDRLGRMGGGVEGGVVVQMNEMTFAVLDIFNNILIRSVTHLAINSCMCVTQ